VFAEGKEGKGKALNKERRAKAITLDPQATNGCTQISAANTPINNRLTLTDRQTIERIELNSGFLIRI
jgi:hypothetical protein